MPEEELNVRFFRLRFISDGSQDAHRDLNCFQISSHDLTIIAPHANGANQYKYQCVKFKPLGLARRH